MQTRITLSERWATYCCWICSHSGAGGHCTLLLAIHLDTAPTTRWAAGDNILSRSPSSRVQVRCIPFLLCVSLLCLSLGMPMQHPFQAAFAVRPLTAAATPDSKAGSGSKQQQGGAAKDGKNALTVDEEEINAITDQIPQRPMGVVEGTSYTVIIIAGIAMAGLHPRSRLRTYAQCQSRLACTSHLCMLISAFSI